MTALCGWIGDALSAPETTLATMGQKLGGANLQRSAIHAPQGALLTAALRQAPAIASDGVLHASILGNPQFADAALRQLAQHFLGDARRDGRRSAVHKFGDLGHAPSLVFRFRQQKRNVIALSRRCAHQLREGTPPRA